MRELFGGCIVQSTLRVATDNEVREAQKLHEQGKCSHNIVRDKPGWLYDYRYCVTCGQGLGAI
jgi:hypothetical protein